MKKQTTKTNQVQKAEHKISSVKSFVPKTVHIYEMHGKVIVETFIGGGLKMKSTTKEFDDIHKVVIDVYKGYEHISQTEYTFDQIESGYYSGFNTRLYQHFSVKEFRYEGDVLVVILEMI